MVTGLATGFVDIDEMTSGLQKGDLVIVAARPAMGKTSFCLNVAQHVALRDGRDGRALLARDVEGAARAAPAVRRRADRRAPPAHRQAQREGLGPARQVLHDLSTSRIFIDDSAAITPLEMRAKCRRLKAEHGLGLIIVDYLQL